MYGGVTKIYSMYLAEHLIVLDQFASRIGEIYIYAHTRST